MSGDEAFEKMYEYYARESDLDKLKSIADSLVKKWKEFTRKTFNNQLDVTFEVIGENITLLNDLLKKHNLQVLPQEGSFNSKAISGSTKPEGYILTTLQ